jgi:hypothetical protein
MSGGEPVPGLDAMMRAAGAVDAASEDAGPSSWSDLIGRYDVVFAEARHVLGEDGEDGEGWPELDDDEDEEDEDGPR